ncbi:MAG TPA: sodium:calcium antiporter [Gammaproteobacteria bacterium]|nr:sodium:calcium antiporter [Gammaproteobacteria bacterium]
MNELLAAASAPDPGWPLWLSAVLSAAAAAAITAFGILMTRTATRLAERTGLGQAVMGALFVGASTSLSEIVTSVTAAAGGHPNLAVSNAVGSIAGQTAFLAVADITYRKANLEHAAASAANLMLGAFLLALLSIPLLAAAGPQVQILGVHPATALLIVAYVYGVRLVSRTHQAPMWHPRLTRETPRHREPTTTDPTPVAALWARFALASVAVGFSGWILAEAGISISIRTGLSETVVGSLLTGLASSLPELVTAVTAVRLGALTLAVGDVLGGNAFDIVIVGLADIAYRKGSIYGAIVRLDLFLVALSILLTSILLMGLVRREKHGIANIGLESFLVLLFYLVAVVVLVIGQ